MCIYIYIYSRRRTRWTWVVVTQSFTRYAIVLLIWHWPLYSKIGYFNQVYIYICVYMYVYIYIFIYLFIYYICFAVWLQSWCSSIQQNKSSCPHFHYHDDDLLEKCETDKTEKENTWWILQPFDIVHVDDTSNNVFYSCKCFVFALFVFVHT